MGTTGKMISIVPVLPSEDIKRDTGSYRLTFAMPDLSSLITAIELHDVEGIQSAFTQGISPNDLHQGVPLFQELTSEYTRSPRFRQCVKAFVDFGLKPEDPSLLAVLLNDASGLEKLLAADGTLIHKSFTLRYAYTPMFEVTLMLICPGHEPATCPF